MHIQNKHLRHLRRHPLYTVGLDTFQLIGDDLLLRDGGVPLPVQSEILLRLADMSLMSKEIDDLVASDRVDQTRRLLRIKLRPADKQAHEGVLREILRVGLMLITDTPEYLAPDDIVHSLVDVSYKFRAFRLVCG